MFVLIAHRVPQPFGGMTLSASQARPGIGPESGPSYISILYHIQSTESKGSITRAHRKPSGTFDGRALSILPDSL